MSKVNELKSLLSKLRTEVSGKTWDTHSETFKDIESVKVRIAHEENKSE